MNCKKREPMGHPAWPLSGAQPARPMDNRGNRGQEPRRANAPARRRAAMAKSQKKSNKEVRKPKAEKPKKQNASNPTQKGIVTPEKK